MNPAATDTKLHRPADVVHRLGRQHNAAAKHYTARHSTDNPPVRREPLPEHVRTVQIPAVPCEVGGSTRRVDVAHLKVPVPLGTRPAVPELVAVPRPALVAVSTEPVAPITETLLKRVLRKLRELR